MRDELDRDADLDGGPPAGPSPTTRGVTVWAGVLVALALAGGIGGWVWTLGTQDPARVPVIAAMAGPVRERPPPEADALTPNRDIASYESGSAGASEPAETRIAPPPVRPTEEDATLSDIEAILGLREADPATVAAVPPADTGPAPDGTPAEVERVPTPPPGTGSDLAPVASPPAPGRPQYLARRMRAASEEVVADAVALAERAATSPWQVQLGAFRDPRLTREQWQVISGTHAGLLEGRALAVQPTQSGGQTFYRLRVGPFASEAEAAALCEALEARGQTCITAENR